MTTPTGRERLLYTLGRALCRVGIHDIEPNPEAHWPSLSERTQEYLRSRRDNEGIVFRSCRRCWHQYPERAR